MPCLRDRFRALFVLSPICSLGSLWVLVVLWLTAAANAQASITTLFTGIGSGNPGNCVYFDVVVPSGDGVLVRGLQVHLNSSVNTPGTIEVYTCAGGRSGNQTTPAAWTLVTSGPVTAAGLSLPSAVAIGQFFLPPGTTGIALRALGVTHRYTHNLPGITSYSNGQLTITGGEATNVPFSGTILTPRMANVTLQYDSLLLTNLGGFNSLYESQIFFDAEVFHPRGIVVNGLDLHLDSNIGNSGTATVWTCSGSRVGQQTAAWLWTQVASGPVTSTGSPSLSRAAIGSFTLPPGTSGIAVRVTGLAHRYGNANNVDANADLAIRGGEVLSGQFTGTLIPNRFVNCRLHYSPGPSLLSNFGSGCVATAGSFYELFANAAAFDFENRAFTMIRDGDGFRVQEGGAFVPPLATAAILQLFDDDETVTPTLAVPFPYGGASYSQLYVCSNGFVSIGNGNGVNYIPSPQELLNAPDASWRVWRDLNPMASGGGRVRFEQRNGIAYITFQGVYSIGGTSSSAANTFQFQFDGNTGNVVVAFGTLADNNSQLLVGFSGSGPSLPGGSRNLSSALVAGFVAGTSDLPLTLNATAPALGQMIRFTTRNIDPQSLFGAVMLGLQTFPAGVSLAPQMPGCFQYTDGGVTLPLFLGGAVTQTTLYATPPLLGLSFGAQAAVYAPAVIPNMVGAAVSNGVRFTVSNY
jgi:hypothetical protein